MIIASTLYLHVQLKVRTVNSRLLLWLTHAFRLTLIQVMKLDPITGTFELIGERFEGEWKWGAGVKAQDGKIYCAPSFDDSVLCIDTKKCQVRRCEAKFGPEVRILSST